MFSSRKRVLSQSSSEHFSSNKRHRPSEQEGYLDYCWRKICNLLGYNSVGNRESLVDDMSSSKMSSSAGVVEEDDSESTDNDDPLIIAPRMSSSSPSEVEILKEVKVSRPYSKRQEVFSPLRSRSVFTVSTKEKRLKDKQFNTPSSILSSVRNASPLERSYSVHQNVFHPRLGKDRRSSFLRNYVSPARPSRSTGLLTSIRLEEKDRYRKLISEYGTQSIKDLVNSGMSPIVARKPPPVVDLMKTYGIEEDDAPVVVAESTPIVKGSSKESDVVEIIERFVKKDPTMPSSSSGSSMPPQKSRVNSLDVELSKSPISYDDFVRKLMEKYNSRSRERERLLQIVNAKKEYYNEKNNKSCRLIEDRIKKHLAITEIEIEIPEKEEEIVQLPEITDDMMAAIKKAYASDGRTIIHEYDTDITRKDIETLKGLNWLNDGVIHFYLQMIVRRSSNAKNNKWPKVYAFNTFFYPKLMSGGHQPLRRWTRKVDIFSYDILLVPVHLGVHWCMATIDFRKPGIFYYDSMGGNNKACLDALAKYLEDEHLDKKKSPFDISRFQKLIVKDMPQQMNGSDCGVFSCKTAEYLSRDVPLSFTQKDMPYFRERMVYEIVTNTLLHP